MTYNMEITSVANTLKKIHLSKTIFNEFTSAYHDNKNDGFGFLLKHSTVTSVKKIDHTALIE